MINKKCTVECEVRVIGSEKGAAFAEVLDRYTARLRTIPLTIDVAERMVPGTTIYVTTEIVRGERPPTHAEQARTIGDRSVTSITGDQLKALCEVVAELAEKVEAMPHWTDQ